MPFVSMPGLTGKIFVPEKQAECLKKFPCKDCFFCEHCSDDRCRVCRGGREKKDTCPGAGQGF